MKITISEFRTIITEEIEKVLESQSAKRHREGPGIVLSRLGGWSAKKQEKGTAPENKGVWAFIYPHFESFLVGSTDDEGNVSGTARPSRYELMKKNKGKNRNPSFALRKTRYSGPIYTHFEVPDAEEVNGWFLTDADSLRKYVFGRERADRYSYSAKQHKKERGGSSSFQPLKRTEIPRYSKDDYEVFIPATGGQYSNFEDTEE